MAKTTAVNLATAARLTASGNGLAVNVANLTRKALLILNASATEAAGNTLDVKLQGSADGATGWADLGIAFAQVTNAGTSFQAIEISADALPAWIRTVDTLAGTTPAVTRSVELIGTPEAS
jgi:hypothetical protein